MMGVGNLVRIDVNNSLAFDRQFVAIMAKPMQSDSVKLEHTNTTTTSTSWRQEFYLKVILGINFWICYNEIILAEAQN